MVSVGQRRKDPSVLFHMSISADQPERVAHAIAELWRGQAFPWANGWWMAMAGDERNTAIEIYPRGHLLSPDKDQAADKAGPGYTATHGAIATPLSEAEVMALAAREGWRAGRLRRGDEFDVIEVWLENVTLFEVLTPPMVEEYLATQTVERWRLKTQAAQARAAAG